MGSLESKKGARMGGKKKGLKFFTIRGKTMVSSALVYHFLLGQGRRRIALGVPFTGGERKSPVISSDILGGGKEKRHSRLYRREKEGGRPSQKRIGKKIRLNRPA